MRYSLYSSCWNTVLKLGSPTSQSRDRLNQSDGAPTIRPAPRFRITLFTDPSFSSLWWKVVIIIVTTPGFFSLDLGFSYVVWVLGFFIWFTEFTEATRITVSTGRSHITPYNDNLGFFFLANVDINRFINTFIRHKMTNQWFSTGVPWASAKGSAAGQ